MAIIDRDLEVERPRYASEQRNQPLAQEANRPNGAAAAAILASGLGSALYGLIVVLAESNEAFRNLMVLNRAVGPLSGKSTFGMLAWLLAWGGLHMLWRDRNVDFGKVWGATLVLIAISLVLTFPLFFLLFAAE